MRQCGKNVAMRNSETDLFLKCHERFRIFSHREDTTPENLRRAPDSFRANAIKTLRIA